MIYSTANIGIIYKSDTYKRTNVRLKYAKTAPKYSEIPENKETLQNISCICNYLQKREKLKKIKKNWKEKFLGEVNDTIIQTYKGVGWLLWVYLYKSTTYKIINVIHIT